MQCLFVLFYLFGFTGAPAKLSALWLHSALDEKFKQTYRFCFKCIDFLHGWYWLLFYSRTVLPLDLPASSVAQKSYKQKKVLDSNLRDSVLLVVLILTIMLDMSFWLSDLLFRLPLLTSVWQALFLLVSHSEHFTQRGYDTVRSLKS